MDRPENSVASAEDVEMVNYNQDEKHEAGDEDFNVWDGNPFPPHSRCFRVRDQTTYCAISCIWCPNWMCCRGVERLFLGIVFYGR